MSSELQESHPHAFMEEELKRSLNEEAYGIAKYEMVSGSPLKATARVVLIENDVILVSLSGRGYQVCGAARPKIHVQTPLPVASPSDGGTYGP